MKRMKNIIWGVLLVAVGIIWGLNVLEITNITIFFDGWWTLFIIVPCVAGLFTDEDKTGNLIGIGIGVILLLACQGILEFEWLWKLFFPAIIIIWGVKLIFGDTFQKKN